MAAETWSQTHICSFKTDLDPKIALVASHCPSSVISPLLSPYQASPGAAAWQQAPAPVPQDRVHLLPGPPRDEHPLLLPSGRASHHVPRVCKQTSCPDTAPARQNNSIHWPRQRCSLLSPCSWRRSCVERRRRAGRALI